MTRGHGAASADHASLCKRVNNNETAPGLQTMQTTSCTLLCWSMAAPVSFNWTFADEHLHWAFEPLPAVQLLRLCAVARQWRDVVAGLLRLRAASSQQQQWSAAMACGQVVRKKRKSACMPQPDELLRRAAIGAREGMHMPPDIALIFASEGVACRKGFELASLADALSELLPPSVLVVAGLSTGAVGPLLDEESRQQLEAHEGAAVDVGCVAEAEETPAVVVALATLPGVRLSWLCLGRGDEKSHEGKRGPRDDDLGEARRHAGAWWLAPAVRPPLPAEQVRRAKTESDPQAAERLRAWGPNDAAGCSRDGGRLLVLHSMNGPQNPWSIERSDEICGRASAVAGGLCDQCVLKPPGATRAEQASHLLLQLHGCDASVCMVPDDNPGGSASFGRAVRLCMARAGSCHRHEATEQSADATLPGGGDVGGGGGGGGGGGSHEEPVFYGPCHSSPPDAPMRPAGGVVFACNGRGKDFHGEAHAEARGLALAVPGVPFVGMFVGGEIGPSVLAAAANREGRGPPHISAQLSYSSVVAMFG